MQLRCVDKLLCDDASTDHVLRSGFRPLHFFAIDRKGDLGRSETDLGSRGSRASDELVEVLPHFHRTERKRVFTSISKQEPQPAGVNAGGMSAWNALLHDRDPPPGASEKEGD